ncbi:cytochrome P450 [Frankia sp. CNm7]|uniref:Cytochrome P450 n=1 Tax=Frankia nepalensis TaxID=1836974 RepID=A0A937UR48_9ACTN|nr:cytochrome P450 [Frankia nepalensis]MBL7496637.1 cytochrome P450 [Frankia nepalensis]MBL7511895.1 cytochrome P450 [Frankia nepalensis]MBL7516646.1 cytochrome P450 [Frankia nepalensis]MBL7627376.1 cytochrome P450 [Frankia nepalensis]
MNPLDAEPEARYAALSAMQRTCPVHQLPGGTGYMAVSYPAVAAGLRSINAFGGSAAQDGLPEEDTTIAGILEPRHLQIRRIINNVVSVHRSQQIGPYLAAFSRDLARAMIARVSEGSPTVEAMGAFVEPIPPAAMARLLGFPEADSARYYEWGAGLGVNIAKAVTAGQSMALRDAGPEMASYVEERIAQRRAMPAEEWPNDALTRFLTTEVDGERLSDRAVVTQIMFAIGAGSDTTRNTLGSMLRRLAADPDLYAEIVADRTLIEPAIEEALRVDSPAQFLVRRCLVPEFDLEGTQISSGDALFLSIGAANRDPEKYPDPVSYDLRRDKLRDHLAFGTGPHTCPGASLARLEMKIAINVWCDHVASFRLTDGYSWEHPRTGMLHGPARLFLDITPR